MRGEWYTTGGDGKGWLILLGVLAGVIAVGSGAVAAVSEFVLVLVAAVGGLVLLLLAAGIWWLVRTHRRGGFAPIVSYQPQALPAPERKVAPPVQPAQQITNNFYGYSAAEVARAMAELPGKAGAVKVLIGLLFLAAIAGVLLWGFWADAVSIARVLLYAGGALSAVVLLVAAVAGVVTVMRDERK